MSSIPGGTAGYHLMFFSAASGKLFANWALSLGSINWSAPLEAVKLPAEAATLAAISGRILKLIHVYAAASLRPFAGSAKVSIQPSAPDLGAMYCISAFSLLSFQPPVSHIIAATISPVRMPLSSWSLLSQKNLRFALHAASFLPTSSISAAYAFGSLYSAKGSLPSANASASRVGRFSRTLVLPLYSAAQRSG
jgi:hypothetical protein